MSDTPITDAAILESKGHWSFALRDKMETLERENAAMRNQLERICKEGFGNQDTIGQEPADDYVLRQLAAMREAIREAHAFIERHTYGDHADDCLTLCGPGAECDCGQFKDRRETLSKLQPFLKP